ncbi:conserved hypothetical protein [delta proteobacterium NaphS2]|nr:conserved hypothetical protein [delta proteobacterium NaphS2]
MQYLIISNSYIEHKSMNSLKLLENPGLFHEKAALEKLNPF